MQIDTQGAIELARFGRGFHWIWTREGITRLCDATTWRTKEPVPEGLPYNLVTNLRVNRPEAHIHGARINSGMYGLLSGESVTSVSVHITDWTRTDLLASPAPIVELPLIPACMVDAFVEAGQAVTAEVGIPSDFRPGPWPALRWRFPTTVMVLSGTPGSVQLEFENPAHVAWLDADAHFDFDDEDEDEEGKQAAPHAGTNWDEFSAMLMAALLRLEWSPRNSVIDVKCDDHRYMQFYYDSRDEEWPGSVSELSLRVTAPADPFGDGKYLARPDGRLSMTESGWRRTENKPGNRWRFQVDWPARYETFSIVAGKAVGALREYFGFESPAQLTMTVW